RLEPDEVIECGIQIADALDAAHTRGIVHRDIKPGNVFLTTRREVKLLDFGVAKRTASETAAASEPSQVAVEERETQLTSLGAVVGTVAYMSPEQARGERVDTRSDLFSFGALLYELATGFRAFPGDTLATTYDATLNRRSVSPGRLNPMLPAA